MQNALENTADAVEIPERHPRLVSQIFRDYRNNSGLFWQVMLPLIIVNLLFSIGIFLLSKSMSPEGQWTISTEGDIAAVENDIAAVENTVQASPLNSTGVKWGTTLGPSRVHIGLLWLAMCPLVFVMVQRHNGINLTFKAVWQQTLRKTVPILGGAFLIGILALGAPLTISFLISKTLDPVYGSPLSSLLICIAVAWFVGIVYFVVKWSLYNQGIIIENLSAIEALRRSSELVRGAWRRFFRIYLLLTWASTVLTSILISLTIVLLSFGVPELVPMRQVFQPMNLLSLFLFAHGKVTLTTVPNFWTIGTIVSVNTLICAILAPIWASLTTHLYTERVGAHARQDSIESGSSD